MIRLFLFLLGFGITVISLSFMIIYLNLLTIGYNFEEYVNFIIRRVECFNIVFGILFMIISTLGGKK